MNYFTAIFALVIGLGCFWMSFKMIKLYLKVKKWKSVNARIISKEIFVHPKYATSLTPYGIKAEYVYEVNGNKYSGRSIHLVELAGGQANHVKKDAEKKLEKIKKIMPVFVDPRDPKKAVMYCEGVGLYLCIFCAGLLAFLTGISILLS